VSGSCQRPQTSGILVSRAFENHSLPLALDVLPMGLALGAKVYPSFRLSWLSNLPLSGVNSLRLSRCLASSSHLNVLYNPTLDLRCPTLLYSPQSDNMLKASFKSKSHPSAHQNNKCPPFSSPSPYLRFHIELFLTSRWLINSPQSTTRTELTSPPTPLIRFRSHLNCPPQLYSKQSFSPLCSSTEHSPHP
jgi:hypothetical protein